MKNKLLLIVLSVSAFMLAFSFFYYLVIYSPKKAEENRLIQVKKAKENRLQQVKDEATRYCLKVFNAWVEETNKGLPEALAGCSVTGICTREQAFEYLKKRMEGEGETYPWWADPQTPGVKEYIIQQCVASYPVK